MKDYVEDSYNYYVYKQMDPRVKKWFLMGSPVPILVIILSYIVFVKWVGPQWMKGRQALNVEKPMLVYNIVQMIINAHLVYETMIKIWIPGHYNIICQKINYEPDPHEDAILEIFYIFMCSRLIDLLDTVFMVLKKNFHQISFLHLYHHLLMGSLSWLFVKYIPGGNVVFIGTVNSFVHAVMYFYYFLTAYDPSFKKSIWWKKHITQLQLVQFLVVLIQQSLAIFSKSCDYPKYLFVFILSQVIVMICLFSRFYHTAYVKNQKLKQS